LFLKAPVIPKDPENLTEYEFDRAQAWEAQEVLKSGGYDKWREEVEGAEEVRARMRKINPLND
jgi:hypothetical protein